MSIHWGSNWGYDVGGEQVRFAHRLIDGGVDIVHGHSSHHPRPIEVYRKRLILYGCGDFMNDYEGIEGYEQFRDDLVLMYFAALSPSTTELASLSMTPMQIRQLKLNTPSEADCKWLCDTLDRVSAPHGAHVDLLPGGTLKLRSD
jgi:poly-gamma-glutamate synthesis protein (capsule biosynthesis protein)